MATILVQTEKDYYYAGQTVNGNVILDVKAKIKGPQGISLRFIGYQCVKWLEQQQIPVPSSLASGKSLTPDTNPPIKLQQIHHIDKIQISECDEESTSNHDLRPKYIRTPENRFYQLKYNQNRNLLTKNNIMIHNCSELAAGQYSFPFSFKTFQEWPGTFSYESSDKKATVSYHLTAAIEPVTPHFQFNSSRQVIIHEKKSVQIMVQKQSSGDITSCCCMSKGSTIAAIDFEKDGYYPNEQVTVLMGIDNSNCTVDIGTITLQLINHCLIKTSENSKLIETPILIKTINGLNAGENFTMDKPIRDHFTLPEGVDMRPTCSGKLVSNQYQLKVRLNYKTIFSCSKVNDIVAWLIVYAKNGHNKIFNLLSSPWNPKIMPAINMPIISKIINQKQATMNQDKFNFH